MSANGHQNNGRKRGRPRKSGAASDGQSNRHGSGIRQSASEVRSNGQRIDGVEIEPIANSNGAERVVERVARNEISPDLNGSENGTGKRIASDNRDGTRAGGRVERDSRDNPADGDSHGNRPETGSEPKPDSEADLRKPLKVGAKRGRKSAKEESAKLTMVMMLSAGLTSIFASVAILSKHKHWYLEGEEAKTLADALNDAISTLPAKYYAQVVGIIEKWIPWINLAFVVYAIVAPRIEESTKLAQERNYRTSETSDRGHGGTENDNYTHWPSSIGGLG